ncbi:MAG: hypothetical protein NTV81_03965 [Candidatus Komeilibacteria bacterium]|nr:hypothetical protein [Candidatus Komeilibacteria bacterium]
MKCGKKPIKIIAVIFAIVITFQPSFGLKAQTTADQTLELQRQLEAIQAEIAQYEKQLTQVSSQKNTLNKKINELKVQQNKVAAQIKQTLLTLKKIEVQLNVVETDITLRQKKLANLQEQLGHVVKLLNEKDRLSLVLVLLSQPTIGGFFNELGKYHKIIFSLGDLTKQIQTEKKNLEDQETALGVKHEEQSNFINIKNLQSVQLTQTLTERKDLLEQTKAKESDYQAELADRKKRATEIKNRIYDLLGVGQQVTFGQAVTIAQSVSGMVGIRAPFLLAILTQESNLGKNVGTCNRPGDPPEKGWRVIMKPERDQERFVTITSELNKNPDITPVSCPMKDSKGKQVGWGGAMGPAQFIPSTWLGYRSKVTAITGKSANPWDIRDAFIAAAIKLKADGAGSQSGEWAAAMKYFSGSTNIRYRFYGDNVVATAKKYEQDIADLTVK